MERALLCSRILKVGEMELEIVEEEGLVVLVNGHDHLGSRHSLADGRQ